MPVDGTFSSAEERRINRGEEKKTQAGEAGLRAKEKKVLQVHGMK